MGPDDLDGVREDFVAKDESVTSETFKVSEGPDSLFTKTLNPEISESTALDFKSAAIPSKVIEEKDDVKKETCPIPQGDADPPDFSKSSFASDALENNCGSDVNYFSNSVDPIQSNTILNNINIKEPNLPEESTQDKEKSCTIVKNNEDAKLGVGQRSMSSRAVDQYQNDYFSDSPPLSPEDGETDNCKDKDEASPDSPTISAWEEAPQGQLTLKFSDVTKALLKKWLQLYWPDDGKWWPGQVLSVDPRKKTVTLLYETGEEEADLDLTELIEKGEVAWLNASDAPKEKPLQKKTTKNSEYVSDYEDEPSTSKERKDSEDDEQWQQGKVRKAAIKSRARYRELSEAESSESDSPPPSDQSSDWHSSDEDNKPRRRPKKKKKMNKIPSRVHHPPNIHQSHAPRHVIPNQHIGNTTTAGSNTNFGRGGIFENNSQFSSGYGSLDSLRSNMSNAPTNINRDSIQLNKKPFGMERNWNMLSSTQGNNSQNSTQYQQGWGNRNHQEINQLLQNRQQISGSGNNNMSRLHLPQASLQGGNLLDLSRFQGNQNVLGTCHPNMQWRQGTGPDILRGDWNSQLGSQPMFLLPQMSQQAISLPQLTQQMALPQLMQQQMAQQQQLQQRLHSQQHTSQNLTQTDHRSNNNLSSATKNMESILTQGLAASGKQVEVQQPNGQWIKGAIVAAMARGPSGGSVMVCYESGEQKQLLANEEGHTYNIRLI